MRYFVIFFCLLIIGVGCAPSPSDSSTTNTADSLQFKNNISTLYGNGGKNAKDNTGLDTASNIIWKDSLGITRSLNNLKGKIVLLNFWAIWCVPCEAEMPDLTSIAETGIVVIAVSAIDPNSSLFQRTILYSETRGLKLESSFQLPIPKSRFELPVSNIKRINSPLVSSGVNVSPNL